MHGAYRACLIIFYQHHKTVTAGVVEVYCIKGVYFIKKVTNQSFSLETLSFILTVCPGAQLNSNILLGNSYRGHHYNWF